MAMADSVDNLTRGVAAISLGNQSLDLFGAFCSGKSNAFFQELKNSIDPEMIMFAFEGLYWIENSVKSGQFPYLVSNEQQLASKFVTPDSCRKFFQWFLDMSQRAHPTTTLLALEGLDRIKNYVQSGQFAHLLPAQVETLKGCLRNWRSEFQVNYKGIYMQVPRILRSLTVFKTLEVPLFIDDYGEKVPLSSFADGQTEAIHIDGNTPICHVTHYGEAESITSQKRIEPSDKKNIIAGCWFGIVEETQKSVYGSKSFQTTLSKLGVAGLNQGENVDGDDDDYDGGTGFQDLRKPTDAAAQRLYRNININAHVEVSIFVPSSFLPDSQKFDEVFEGPSHVPHKGFCIRAAREKFDRYACQELEF